MLLPVERPDFIMEKIEQLDRILTAMPPDEVATFHGACRRDPEIKSNTSLRLKFLRAEGFQPGLAAHRLTQYFDTVQVLFGRDTVGQDLVLSNLLQPDMEALRSGGVQLLSQTDASSRPVIIFNEANCRYTDSTSMLRAFVYMIDVISRDEDAQKQGLVRIRYDVGTNSTKQLNMKLFQDMERFMRFAAPIKTARIHLVHDDAKVLQEMEIICASLADPSAARSIVLHVATSTNYESQLSPYGISEMSLPIAVGDKIIVDKHTTWLAKREIEERNVATSYRVMLEDQGSGGGGGSSIPFQKVATPFFYHSDIHHVATASSPQQSSCSRFTSQQPIEVVQQPTTVERKEESGGAKKTLSLPMILSLEADKDVLSGYQCFLREQLEAFEATHDDVQYNASRMSRSISIGQVGLRCRHCSSRPEWARSPGAVYYPGSMNMLYQAAQNLAKNHICEGCQSIPSNIQQHLNMLRADKRRAMSGKQYWRKTAIRFGIYEKNKGLWFDKTGAESQKKEGSATISAIDVDSLGASAITTTTTTSSGQHAKRSRSHYHQRTTISSADESSTGTANHETHTTKRKKQKNSIVLTEV